METKKLTCIVCPMGCPLEVTLEGGNVLSVTGNTCPRGEKYAREECTHPTRALTSTVKVTGGVRPVCPVKTSAPIPKELLFQAMEEIRGISAAAPVAIGQEISADLCGAGISLIATAGIEKGRKL